MFYQKYLCLCLCVCVCVSMYLCVYLDVMHYGVATIGRLLKIICLFYKRAL